MELKAQNNGLYLIANRFSITREPSPRLLEGLLDVRRCRHSSPEVVNYSQDQACSIYKSPGPPDCRGAPISESPGLPLSSPSTHSHRRGSPPGRGHPRNPRDLPRGGRPSARESARSAAPGADFSRFPPPRRPSPQTLAPNSGARRDPRPRAPHPSPLPARVRAGGEGGSVSCPEFAAFASVLQFWCGAGGARPPAEQPGRRGPDARTPARDRLTRAALGRGGREGEPRPERGRGACGGVGAPAAPRLLPARRPRRARAQVGTLRPSAPRRRGQGRGEGWARGPRAGPAARAHT